MNQPIARALRAGGDDRGILLDSVYHSGNGDFAAGFRQGVGLFRELSGQPAFQ